MLTLKIRFLLLVHRKVKETTTSRGEERIREFAILVPNWWYLGLILLVSLLFHPLYFSDLIDINLSGIMFLSTVVASEEISRITVKIDPS